jgi:hypothetical protein
MVEFDAGMDTMKWGCLLWQIPWQLYVAQKIVDN